LRFWKYFVLILLAVLVVSAFALSAIYQSAKDQAIKDLNTTQMVHARQAAMSITHHMNFFISTLNLLARMPDIVDLNDTGRRFMAGYQQLNAREIKGITRVDARGRIVYTSPFDEEVIGRDISGQEHVRTILMTHQTVISDVFTAVQGFRAIAVHVPVSRNGDFDGTIGILLSFDSIAQRHIENIRIGRTGYAWVISEKGIEISCPVPGHVDRSVFDTCRDFPEILAMAREMMKGRKGITTYHYDRIRGTATERVLKHAVYLPIPMGNTFWSIVVATPEDEVTASLAGLRIKLLIGIASLLTISMIFTYLLLRSRIIVREQKERETVMRALEESEERYRLLAENANDIIFTMDTNLRFTYASPSVERIRGFSVKEALAQSPLDVLTPASLDLALNIFDEERRIEESGRGDPSRTKTLELEVRCRDGSTIWTETTFSPLRDHRKRVTGIMGITRDITERKQAEETIREREEMLNAFVQASRDWIWAMDLRSVHTFSNPAVTAILGYAVEEIVGASLELMHPDDRKMVENAMPTWLAEKRGWQNLLVRFRHKDGTWRFLESSSVPILDPVGEVIGFQGVDRDVTERMQTEAEQQRLRDQLSQIRKMESVGQLAGGIAHDFNNMLTPIMGYAELLSGNLPPDDPRRSYVEQILRSAERSRDLVRQLLAFARKQTLEMKPVDLNRVIENFEKMLSRALHENIVIRTGLFPGLGTIMADVGQIEQIILNLAVNAQDAMPDGGTLSIETDEIFLDTDSIRSHEGIEPGPFVLMRLSDTGTGMDSEILSHLFEPFFTTKSPGKGTGLGLATVYGIASQHGGFISVSSEPGKGTTFRVYIPRYGESSPEGVQEKRHGMPLHGRETLLVVEDEDQVRDLITGILEGYGYRVFASSNASAALELSSSLRETIDLLITDVILPDLNGKALFERLSAARPDLRVLYMSGYTADVITQHGVLESGVTFIQKPFSLQGLAQKVRELLDSMNA